MARQYAAIHLSVWNAGSDFAALTGEAQRVYFLAISQHAMTYCGVVPYQPRKWAQLAKDGSVPKIRKAVAELEKKRYVMVDSDTEELWVRSFVKHNKILEQAQLHKSMNESYEHISSLAIKVAFYDSLPEGAKKQLKPPYPAPSPPPCPPPSSGGCSGSDGIGIQTLVSSSLPVPEPSPEPSPVPEPTPPPVPSPAGDVGEQGAVADLERVKEIATQNGKRALRWTDDAMDRFGLSDRQAGPVSTLMLEATTVLSDQLIEECLGYCAQLDAPPKTAKYLRATFAQWGEQRGIDTTLLRRGLAS